MPDANEIGGNRVVFAQFAVNGYIVVENERFEINESTTTLRDFERKRFRSYGKEILSLCFFRLYSDFYFAIYRVAISLGKLN